MRQLRTMAIVAILAAVTPAVAAETRLGPAPPQQQGQPMQLAEYTTPQQCADAVANAKAAKLPLPTPEYLAWASIATQRAWCPEFAVWLKENQAHFVAAPPATAAKPPKSLVLGPVGPFHANKVVEHYRAMTSEACDVAVQAAIRADGIPPGLLLYAKIGAAEALPLCPTMLDWVQEEENELSKLHVAD